MIAMAGTQEAALDAALQTMRERWAPEWRVWRSRDSRGELNCWCATRRGRGGETSMTLMERTADELEAALHEQGQRVGQALMRIGYPG